MVRTDPHYADKMAHQLNIACAVVQFILYNVSVVLIFVINCRLYANEALPSDVITDERRLSLRRLTM